MWLDPADGGHGRPCLMWNDSGINRAAVDCEWVAANAGKGKERGEICADCEVSDSDGDESDGLARRSWRPVQIESNSNLAGGDGTPDFPALAGQQEKLALKHFGYSLVMISGREICIEDGLDNRGYILPDALRYLFGVGRYEELWGSSGCVAVRVAHCLHGGTEGQHVNMTMTREAAEMGLTALREACRFRSLDLERCRNRRFEALAQHAGAHSGGIGVRRQLRGLQQEENHRLHLHSLEQTICMVDKAVHQLPAA
jgi:hypothetical protein